MKTKLFMSIFAGLLVSGCGGGGGDDDSFQVCKDYCETACVKAAGCRFFPTNEVSVCSNSCTQQLVNPNADTCRQANDYVLNASCAELATVLNLRDTSEAAGENLRSLAE